MSAADLMAVLLARHLRYHWQRPDDPAVDDHLIFSKGHASPLLYSMFKAAGVISDEKLINGYRRFGSVLQGHPTPVLPWIDVATGSLGQGLPDGVGVALAGRYLDELPLPAPAHYPAHGAGPNDYAGGRGNSVARTSLGRPVPRAGGSPANFGRRE